MKQDSHTAAQASEDVSTGLLEGCGEVAELALDICVAVVSKD